MFKVASHLKCFLLFSFLAWRLGKTLFLGSAGVTSGSQQRMIVKEIKQLLDNHFASSFVLRNWSAIVGVNILLLFFSIKNITYFWGRLASAFKCVCGREFEFGKLKSSIDSSSFTFYALNLCYNEIHSL